MGYTTTEIYKATRPRPQPETDFGVQKLILSNYEHFSFLKQKRSMIIHKLV